MANLISRLCVAEELKGDEAAYGDRHEAQREKRRHRRGGGSQAREQASDDEPRAVEGSWPRTSSVRLCRRSKSVATRWWASTIPDACSDGKGLVSSGASYRAKRSSGRAAVSPMARRARGGSFHAKATTRFPLRIEGSMRPRPVARLPGVHARPGQRVSVGRVELIGLEAN